MTAQELKDIVFGQDKVLLEKPKDEPPPEPPESVTVDLTKPTPVEPTPNPI